MKIILQKPVDKLGNPGDTAEVADGYARNYLVPRGKAMPATKGVVAQSEAMRRNREAREVRDREGAEALAAQLSVRPIELKARAGEGGKLFGSITAADIAEAVLAQTGVELDRRKVVLSEPIREIGNSEVTIQLPADVVVALPIAVLAED
jgi:large subunit ribosomal protein L9